jgi:hypothetical protein
MRLVISLLFVAGVAGAGEPEARPHVTIRGIYGGVPEALMKDGRTLKTSSVNAVWIGERGVTKARVERLRSHGARVFAEFNTLHRAEYLKKHPDAAPVGPDGTRSPAPHGWQGICPTHEAYRKWRMEAFGRLLSDFALDGVWLDYHHAHSSWERAEPALPDTCFCPRCLARFKKDTGLEPTDLLTSQRAEWTRWRCGVFTDWVREFRSIVDKTRPKALLGTFHCPWSDEIALREKLAIDLRAQSEYVDVFSPMPYHARFGHADDPAWISRQTVWLGKHLDVRGVPGERIRIWPIVQLADWGEPVPLDQIGAVLDHGTRRPATGVSVFRWGVLRKQPDKVKAMVASFVALTPR